MLVIGHGGNDDLTNRKIQKDIQNELDVKKFIVIRCPNCGKWTYAKVTQKTRFCSRCVKNFKINPIQVIYVESHQKANYLVKLKNREETK